MKLATLRDGSRDGKLAIVSRDLTRALPVPEIAPTLQAALDDWRIVAPRLERASAKLEAGEAGAIAFSSSQAMAPLPRCTQWADFSAYVTHVELVRRARGADMPDRFWTDPLCYQGAGDCNLGPTEPIPLTGDELGLDFEGEIGAIVDDVPAGVAEADAAQHIRLLVLLNDLTLRKLVPDELAKGFGFFQSKPQTAFSPVAVTPDELGRCWDGGKVHLPLRIMRNEALFGAPHAGRDMVFSFPRMIAHAAATRPIGAGGIIGSGTVSNADRSVGSACIAERRAEETVQAGAPTTPFLSEGERIRIEILDESGRSIFGAIDQRVARP